MVSVGRFCLDEMEIDIVYDTVEEGDGNAVLAG